MSAALLVLLLGGCDRVLGLREFSVSPAADGGEQGCPGGRCVALRSEDCATITGPMNDPRAIVIGSLFSTSGAQAATNLARQDSAILAVEEINAAGGVNTGDGALRPLLMVSCDEAGDLLRAGRHLIDELGVRAIIGPNTSQDTLDLATKLSIAAGALVISPTAVAGDIADLLDDDTSWLMVPSDAQRAPLMAARINALEAELQGERGRELRLGVLLRDDVLGRGARVALSSLKWNGSPLASAQNFATAVRIDNYDPAGVDAAALVADYVRFAPDVIVMVGTAETITQLMLPLERAWTAPERPQYVLTDSSKVPELLDAVRDDDALRARISGTGVRPLDSSVPVHDAFTRAYRARFYADGDATSGMGQAYDAAYVVANAYAAARSAAVSGKELARGLRSLHGGANTFAVGADDVRATQDVLARGTAVDLRGTFAPLHWDERGAVLEGAIEIWCVAADGGGPAYASSGLSYDLASGQTQGSYRACSAPAADGGEDAVASPTTPSQATDAGATPSTPRGPTSPGDAAASEAGAPSPSPSRGPTAPAMPAAGAGAPPSPPSGPASAPAMPAAGAGASPPPPSPVMCGAEKCAAGEACCVSLTPPGVPASAAAISCTSLPVPCAELFRCSRDSDCGSGMHCCESAGTAQCTPATQACSGARFACHSARDCAAGQQCCSHLNAEQTGYAATSCETGCDASANSSPLCESDADCSADLRCRVSNYLANLSVCDR